jgi:hypothetical protein
MSFHLDYWFGNSDSNGSFLIKCHNLNLRLATKARVCKGAGQEWAWKSHIMLSGMQKSVREWTLTLPSEFPFWELESWWTPKFSKSTCRGQNSLDWKVRYIIETFVERICLKWAHMTHLDTWNTSYDQKKGRESNCQFDSQPLKVRNRPNFLVCRWHVTYHWKAFDEGYNVSTHKVMRPQNYGRLFGTKCHLDVGFMERHRVCYKGEGGGFPQV